MREVASVQINCTDAVRGSGEPALRLWGTRCTEGQNDDTRVPFDRAPFAADMCEWEQSWSRQVNAFPVTPTGDAIAVATRLAVRYRDLLLSP